jgi:hypothetical protein
MFGPKKEEVTVTVECRREMQWDSLFGLVVEFLATDPEASGSIPSATGFSEK